MSTMRSAARGLGEHRSETFASRHALLESQRRVQAALEHAGLLEATAPSLQWQEAAGQVTVTAHYPPSASTQRFLKGMSIGMTLLVAASVWAVMSSAESRALAFLLPLFTALMVLAFPFVALALASQREARESRVRRAIRAAIVEEERP